jgi:hypothetical protein
MTRTGLARDLAAKLGVSPARIYQRAERRRAELPMSTQLAIATIAFEEGHDITSYLDADAVAEVRGLMTQLRAVAPVGADAAPAARAGGAAKGGRAAPKPALVSIAGVRVAQLPGMSAARAREAKLMAEKVYPMLYVFENSAREVISTILRREVGEDWWEKVVPKRVQATAAKHKADEAKDPWHGKRGAAPIDYLLLSELPSIVAAPAAWPHFKDLFGRVSWFEELVADFNVSRRVASHMNPLEEDDIKNLEAAFRKWSKLLSAKKDLLV